MDARCKRNWGYHPHFQELNYTVNAGNLVHEGDLDSHHLLTFLHQLVYDGPAQVTGAEYTKTNLEATIFHVPHLRFALFSLATVVIVAALVGGTAWLAPVLLYLPRKCISRLRNRSPRSSSPSNTTETPSYISATESASTVQTVTIAMAKLHVSH